MLFCYAYMVEAFGNFNLNQNSNTFDESLIVTVTIKILFEDQIPVSIPPEPSSPTQNPNSATEQQFPESAPQKPPSSILNPVLATLEVLAGKIRTQIGNRLFKEQLLQQITKVKSLLESGRVLETLVSLNTIAIDLQRIFNSSPSMRVHINLVLADLNLVERELKIML